MLPCAPAWALKLDGLKPGKTYRVERIVFSGNHALSDGELLSHMTTKERPFYLFWQKRPEFDPDVFTEDLKRLALLYRSHGYFQAHPDYDLKVDGDLVTPEIKITENRPVHIQQVHIVVNRRRLPPQNPLYAHLQVKPGRIFDDTAYQASEVMVRDFYRNEGYAHATTQRWAEVNVFEDAVRI
jgi:outer membrane protein assembly factor BamA